MKRLLITLAAASLLGACAKKSDESLPVAPAPQPGPAPVGEYKAMTPEQLFASKYDRAYVMCYFDVAENGQKPVSPCALQADVFPRSFIEGSSTCSGPTGLARTAIDFDKPVLATLDLTMNGKVVSQSPLLRVSGKIMLAIGDGLSMETTFESQLIPDHDFLEVGSAHAIDNKTDGSKLEGLTSIKCRLKTEAPTPK